MPVDTKGNLWNDIDKIRLYEALIKVEQAIRDLTEVIRTKATK
jgi:hypothetical protein